jgi:hypothetical protein
MVQLPREFKKEAPTWVTYVFGCLFGGAGLAMLAIGIVAVLLRAEPKFVQGPLGMGALFLCVGIGAPILMRRLYTSLVINCTLAGFSVTSQNKRSGRHDETYRWDEVTSTSYEESGRDDIDSKSIHFTFSVETARGRAFKSGQFMHPFDELITVFNEQTPQLPYVWVRPTQNSSYEKTPRLSHTVLPPPPPPGPTSRPPPLPPSN